VLAERAQEGLARREADIARREREAKGVESRLSQWSDELRRREGELEVRGLRVEHVAYLSSQPQVHRAKVGRNEPCPCGAGRKYKRCHGSPASQRPDASGAGGLKG